MSTFNTVSKQFLLTFFMLYSFAANAQSDSLKIDSLKKVLLKEKEDTIKVNLLNELTKAYWYYNLDTAASYNYRAEQLADNLSYKKGLAESYRCHGVILNMRYDSSALNYLNKALKLFEALELKRGIAATLNNQSAYYSHQNQLEEALAVSLKSLNLFTALNDKEAIGAVTNQVGTIYEGQASFSKALEYYLKALDIRKQIGDKPGTAFTLNRVGDMYFKLKQLTDALTYYKQSLQLSQALHRDPNIIDVASSIGSVYLEQGKYEDALVYFNIKLKAEEKYFGKDSIFYTYIQLGKVYDAAKKYDPALQNFNKALGIIEKKYTQGGADVLCYIGRVYLKQGDLKKATANCTRSLQLAQQNKDFETIRDASLVLSDIYASAKNYQKAYDFRLLYITAKDTLLNENLNQQLASVKQSFEVRNRESQIDLLNRDKALQQSELNRQKQQRYFLVGGILLFLVLILILAVNNRRRRKTNHTLEKTLSHLKSTQAQLIQSEKMASLGELTAGIAHEIQNPLNFVNNFSEVSRELIDELKSQKSKLKSEEQDEILNDIDANLEKINHHGKRADAIVKGMLQHSRQTKGIKEPTDINALCNEYLKLSYHGLRAKDKNFNADIKTDFDETIGKISIVPQDIGRVLLNLFNNAFYAVNEKAKLSARSYQPIVNITTRKLNDKISISVKDNGSGIPSNIIDKIFQPFFTTKPAGQGTGLGLSLSYDIIKAHGGDIKAETKEGEETTFIVQLPRS